MVNECRKIRMQLAIFEDNLAAVLDAYKNKYNELTTEYNKLLDEYNKLLNDRHKTNTDESTQPVS